MENQFSKYKSLNVDEIRTKINDLRLGYESLCMKTSGFPEDEVALRRRRGEKVAPKKTEKRGGIASQQAIMPELNSNFINNGRLNIDIELRLLIENERQSNQSDQTKLNSLFALKTILENYETYKKVTIYTRAVDKTFDKIDKNRGLFITQAIAAGLEPISLMEDELVRIINDLQNHMNQMEALGTSKRIEDVVIEAGKSRYELDKVTVNILEGYSAAIRGYCTSAHTVNTITENRLDVLDQDQLNIVEQSYCSTLTQFDKMRQVCTDASKVYAASNLLSRAFAQLSNFTHNLFTNLLINPNDLAREMISLKSFNEYFRDLESIFKKAQVDVNTTKNEASLLQNIQDFTKAFKEFQTNYQVMEGATSQMKRLFEEVNEEEMTDAYDYMLMIKEVFAIFRKILNERMESGFADVASFKELENNLEDKPEALITLGTNFRASFS